MHNVTSAHSKSFPSPWPRLGAKQGRAFIRDGSQISQSKDKLLLPRFMGKNPQPSSMTRLQLNITIFAAKDVNLDRGAIKPIPALSLPFKPQPHQRIFIFIGLQVSLLNPWRRRGLKVPHIRRIMKGGCFLLKDLVNLFRSTLYFLHVSAAISTGAGKWNPTSQQSGSFPSFFSGLLSRTRGY